MQPHAVAVQVCLADDELRRRTPLEVVRIALPSELASRLLAELLQDQANWEQGTWWMNSEHALFGSNIPRSQPRGSSVFSADAENGSNVPPARMTSCCTCLGWSNTTLVPACCHNPSSRPPTCPADQPKLAPRTVFQYNLPGAVVRHDSSGAC